MKDESVAQILGQVKLRYDRANRAFEASDYNEADLQLSELRDVLDDVYDRPDEDVEAGISGGGQ